MLQDGPRGVGHVHEPPEDMLDPQDMAGYDIDWAVAEDVHLMGHLLEQNPTDSEDENPFANEPALLSHVPCNPPDCPLDDAQVALLDAQLAVLVNINSRDMGIQ